MDNDQVQGQSIDERIAAATAEPQVAPAVEDIKKQPEPMPSSDQNPTEVEEAPQAPVPEGSEPVFDEEKEALDNSKNPERTRAYIEKLKSELKEAKSKAMPIPSPEPPSADYGTSVFDVFHSPQAVQPAPNLSPSQVEDVQRKYIDDQGNVDIAGFNEAITKANQEAQQATAYARNLEDRIARVEETQEAREAYKEHPELNPLDRNKFDPKFFEFVRDRLLRNMYEGRREPLGKVASEIRSYYAPVNKPVDQGKIQEEAVRKYKEQQQARVQGPIEQGKGEVRNADISLDELRSRTRQGDEKALSLRLKSLGV